eukprot:5441978-Prymnesium_polylepis.1
MSPTAASSSYGCAPLLRSTLSYTSFARALTASTYAVPFSPPTKLAAGVPVEQRRHGADSQR